MGDSPIIGTIIAKNYLASARTLARSIAQRHPQMRIVVLVVDEIGDYFNPASEPFETWLASDLRIPNWSHVAAKYSILELCTAAKPFFLQRLLEQAATNKAIYFDPDIVVYHPLDSILALLDSHLAVLTPHILEPLCDTYRPGEIDLLRAGTYNLGFFAVSRQGDWRALLQWWQTRLYDGCYVDQENGLFVDQRWCDLIPSLFAPVHILRDPGYNVAYWNLSSRSIAGRDSRYTVNGVPLVFFHFSGFNVDNPESVSRYQNRFTLSDLNEDTRRIYLDYQARLKSEGYEDSKAWPYTYGFFSDGTAIPGDWRRNLRSYDPIGCRWQNPFRIEASDTFRRAPPVPSGGTVCAHARGCPAQRPAGEPHRLFMLLVASYHRIALATQRRGLGEAVERLSGHQAVRGLRQKLGTHLSTRFGRNGFPEAPGSGPGQATAQPQAELSAVIRPDNGDRGVNVIGYLRSENGVGQAARNLISSLRSVGYPVATQTLVANDMSRKQDLRPEADPQGDNVGITYGTNIFCVNADMTYEVFGSLGPRAYLGRKNIALWFWELSAFPTRWRDHFSLYHEIWTASRFVQEAVATCSPIPVMHTPLAIHVPLPPVFGRADFRLPEDRHLFLYTFDALSHLERKNPLGVVEAFRAAFTAEERHRTVQLVMKVTNLGRFPEYAARLRAAVSGVGGILIDRYLERLQTNALTACCDTYVSLHRSEGFGLTIAEAMALGKPVVATAYSGNMDFMNEGNSYPVPSSLIRLDRASPPYDIGNEWADPNIESAAESMRRIVAHPDEAKARGAEAASTIGRMYNSVTVGNAIRGHLERLDAERSRPPALNNFAHRD